MSRLAWPVLLVLGCGGGGTQGSDAGTDATEVDMGVDAFAPASHPAMPVATSLGGAVLSTPKLVAISFSNDTAMQPAVDAFAMQMQTASAYWTGAVAEYGVGALTASTFHSADSPSGTISDGDVQSWLQNAIATVSGFPQPDASTIYTLFYPSNLGVTVGGGTTCVQLQGYHSSFPFHGGNVIYAVVPRCQAPLPSITLADQMTAEASHEIVEAATDPLPFSHPAYITVDGPSHAWELLAEGEIGDLCAAFPDSFYQPSGFDHLVQRVWSNASAAAGHDPCEPQGTSPYFNAAPVLPDTITVTVGGSAEKTMGVKLSAGQSKTIELDLYSDAPTPPWTVSALDVTSAFFGGQTALSFSFDQTTGQNGDVIHLTIQSMRPVAGGALFWIESDLGTRTGSGVFTCLLPACKATVWLGAVSFD